MKIVAASRILDRRTDKNTTYARSRAARLLKHTIPVRRILMGTHPILTLLRETGSDLPFRGSWRFSALRRQH